MARRNATLAFALCAVSALLIKVILAVSSYGSTDILLFEADVTTIQQEGGAALYRDGVRTEWCGWSGQRPCPPFNHPPLIMHALQAWDGLARLSGLPLRFWLRLTCALADLGTFAVLLSLYRETGNASHGAVLLLYAASPVAILISGFHGNTDPVMIFLVVLAVALIEAQRPAWLAGLAFGAATSIKLVPLFLVPLVLCSLPNVRRRLAFIGGAALVPLLASVPFALAEPQLVASRLFSYSPQAGTWGLSVLAVISQGGRSLSVYEAYARYGKFLTLVVIAGASVWFYFRREMPRLRQRVGFLLCLLLVSAPGFGVQYLVWLLPYVVSLGVWPMTMYSLACTVFLAAYYSAAAGTFPWYVANTLAHPPWNGTVVGLGLICWAVVCYLTVLYARAELVGNGEDSPARSIRREDSSRRPQSALR